jgi:hypothetical protein
MLKGAIGVVCGTVRSIRSGSTLLVVSRSWSHFPRELIELSNLCASNRLIWRVFGCTLTSPQATHFLTIPFHVLGRVRGGWARRRRRPVWRNPFCGTWRAT